MAARQLHRDAAGELLRAGLEDGLRVRLHDGGRAAAAAGLHRPFELLFLDDNKLEELPDSLANVYSKQRRNDGYLHLARNFLTALPAWVNRTDLRITSINAEGNRIRALPLSVPSGLKTLRLAGNPMQKSASGGESTALQLSKLLAIAGPSLVDFTIGVSQGGRDGQIPWDGMKNDYVITDIPGIRHGIVSCSFDAPCPFTIKTDWNHDAFSTGGLELHFCVNTTAGSCGCGGGWPAEPAGAPLPPAGCFPATDNHDGTYSGLLDSHSMGVTRAGERATIRWFQRAAATASTSSSAAPKKNVEEVVIGLWADGSACEGATPGPSFQSRGGNCFRNVLFA